MNVGLAYCGLADRFEQMNIYRITDCGETPHELLYDDISGPTELRDRLRETHSNPEWERLRPLRAEWLTD